MNPALFLPTAIAGYLSSVINVAYIINMGRFYGVLTTSRKASWFMKCHMSGKV